MCTIFALRMQNTLVYSQWHGTQRPDSVYCTCISAHRQASQLSARSFSVTRLPQSKATHISTPWRASSAWVAVRGNKVTHTCVIVVSKYSYAPLFTPFPDGQIWGSLERDGWHLWDWRYSRCSIYSPLHWTFPFVLNLILASISASLWWILWPWE